MYILFILYIYHYITIYQYVYIHCIVYQYVLYHYIYQYVYIITSLYITIGVYIYIQCIVLWHIHAYPCVPLILTMCTSVKTLVWNVSAAFLPQIRTALGSISAVSLLRWRHGTVQNLDSSWNAKRMGQTCFMSTISTFRNL